MLNSLNTKDILGKIVYQKPAPLTGIGLEWRPGKSREFILIDDDLPLEGIYIWLDINFIRTFARELPTNVDWVFKSLYQSNQLEEKFLDGLIAAIKSEILSKPGVLKSNELIPPIAPVSLQWFRNFLIYTYDCLNYIYDMPSGKGLLDELLKVLRPGSKKVYIKPTIDLGNHVVSTAQICIIAQLARDNFKTVLPDWPKFKIMLQKASMKQDPNAQIRWLKKRINEMPLYSLFEKPKYRNGFFNKYRPIKMDELKEWFEEGYNSDLRKDLEKLKEENVNFLQYFNLAIIITLHDQSPPGRAKGSKVYFNVTDSEKNLERPPAIGLAHELIHAYYNALGHQPGINKGNPTTTAYELLCVGLSPWTNQPYSENKIRAEWPPKNAFIRTDKYNNKKVGVRHIYSADDPAVGRTDPESNVI